MKHELITTRRRLFLGFFNFNIKTFIKVFYLFKKNQSWCSKRGTDRTRYGSEIGLEAALLSLSLSFSFFPSIVSPSRALSFNPSRRSVRCDFPAATYAGLYIHQSASCAERGEHRSSYRSTAEQ